MNERRVQSRYSSIMSAVDRLGDLLHEYELAA